MRLIAANDRPALLALNNRHATELSPLDGERFRRMIDAAFAAHCTNAADAFILAFDQDGDYDSANFHWFRQRHPRFVYVDRVVVEPAHRRQGVARRLYDLVEQRAGDTGHVLVGCEVNLDPPNPVSDRFHAARGYAELGTATLAAGGKTVRYLGRALDR